MGRGSLTYRRAEAADWPSIAALAARRGLVPPESDSPATMMGTVVERDGALVAAGWIEFVAEAHVVHDTAELRPAEAWVAIRRLLRDAARLAASVGLEYLLLPVVSRHRRFAARLLGLPGILEDPRTHLTLDVRRAPAAGDGLDDPCAGCPDAGEEGA